MIVVTGTKRSGTSMWMQALRAAGLPVLGEAFPQDWGDTIRAANPEGFFESRFRDGIWFRTNPHPETGEFVHPNDVRTHVVKIFIPGLVRTDLAFVDKVVGTMRNWREYGGSLERLYAMEHENRNRLKGRDLPKPTYIPPIYEWWEENFALVGDIVTRRHHAHVVAYESTLRDPAAVIAETIEWLGVGDAAAAIATVKPELRTQDATDATDATDAESPPEVEPHVAEVFDELYARVVERRALDGDFIDRLNAIDDELAPKIAETRKRVHEEREVFRAKVAEVFAGEAPAGDETPRAPEPS